jgi:hypothetical protein
MITASFDSDGDILLKAIRHYETIDATKTIEEQDYDACVDMVLEELAKDKTIIIQ